MIDLADRAVAERTRGLVQDETAAHERADVDARMIWSALTEPGDAVAGAFIASTGPRRALEVLGSSDAAPQISAHAEVDSQTAAASLERWLARQGDAAAASGAARRAQVRVLTPEQDSWPEGLRDLGPHSPHCLWLRGDSRVLSSGRVSVALVGARAATAYGQDVVSQLAAELAADGAVIVSGGAYGIDGMAHRAALTVGGATVAWLAGGVDRPYPAGNRQLLESIAQRGGAVVAEAPCGSAPTKWRFLARNRLIAASSAATVVVEAGWRSGSINTAGHAAALGRPLGAVPGPVTSAASAGCHRLLREYAAECVTSASDVRELWGDVGPRHEGTSSSEGRTDDATRVLDALSSRVERDIGEVVRRCGMSADQCAAMLGLLALDGRAERGTRGWRAVRR